MPQATAKLTAEEIREICSKYEYSPTEDFWADSEDVDDRVLRIKKAMSYLDRSDYVMMCLAIELQSERKVADVLNVSRTPVHKCLLEIKEKLMKIYDGLD